MEKIKNIVLCICLLAVAISVLDVISPGKRLKKQLSFLFSLVFIIAIFTPFVNGEISFEIPSVSELEEIEAYEEISDTVNELAEREITYSLTTVLSDALIQNGISADKIYFDINIEDNDSISISSAEIHIKDIYSEEKTRDIAISLFGEDAVYRIVKSEG